MSFLILPEIPMEHAGPFILCLEVDLEDDVKVNRFLVLGNIDRNNIMAPDT